MIIDCHTHINNYHDEQVESLAQSIESLQLEMRRNRVDMALILTSYKINPGRPSTKDVVEATRHLKTLFVIAGISFDQINEETVRELRAFLEKREVYGLKLYPGYQPFFPSDLKLAPLYELAAEFNVPVMIHTGDTYDPKGKIKFAHPLHVDEVAVDFPNVKFVICHLGNPWLRDTMEIVYKNQNVYTDISGLVLGDFSDRFEVFMAKQLQEMLLYGVEPDRVLFGTDWPISSMDSYLRFMEELKVPDNDKEKILWENAARLFKLPVDGATTAGSALRKLFR